MVALHFSGEDARNVVLIKFALGDDDTMIPEGIHFAERKSDAEMDSFHARTAAIAGDHKLGKLNRHRPGRVDTGEAIIQTSNVLVSGLAGDLIEEGYIFTGYHRFERSKNDKKQHTIVLEFRKDGTSVGSIPPLVKAFFVKLAAMTWASCSVWDNPDGTMTINLSGWRRRRLVINEHRITHWETEWYEEVVPEAAQAAKAA